MDFGERVIRHLDNTMAGFRMRVAILALLAVLSCSVIAQEVEKSATEIDVSSLGTEAFEEQLQVFQSVDNLRIDYHSG